ncbi:hypothetical protein ACO2Q3_02265 [Caulobacter sp. KR2-114]|uniref:hypothetical protein n=1 Tax=Caulobacter sp. KR2-114 TaxID=3400912 RepID=UPI003BFFEEAD
MFHLAFHVRRLPLAILLIALPAAASAEPLTPVGVFLHAAIPVKLIILGLIAATIAALVIVTGKLTSGPKLSGGSAFLSGLRLGGPLAGLVGAAYGALNMCLNLANIDTTPPINILARGGSEVMFLVLLGLVAGSVGVIAHWAIEARIDRTVLAGA